MSYVLHIKENVYASYGHSFNRPQKFWAKLCLLNSKCYFHPLTGPNHAVLCFICFVWWWNYHLEKMKETLHHAQRCNFPSFFFLFGWYSITKQTKTNHSLSIWFNSVRMSPSWRSGESGVNILYTCIILRSWVRIQLWDVWSGITERSDSRRILTLGSFFYVEMWPPPPPVNILRRKVLDPFSVVFMALGYFFSV
jgi:hypothetical protein